MLSVETLTGVVLAAPSGDPEYRMLPILPYLPELFFGLVAFGIFYFVIKNKVVPPLEKVIADRQEAIEGGIARAEQAQADAAAAKKQYEDQLAGARDEAAKIREHAKEQGAQIIAELRQQAQTEADRIKETAHKQIEADRQQAFVSLRHDVGQLSTDLASRIVGESLEDEARQSGVIERFLADLEAGDTAASQNGDSGVAVSSEQGR